MGSSPPRRPSRLRLAPWLLASSFFALLSAVACSSTVERVDRTVTPAPTTTPEPEPEPQPEPEPEPEPIDSGADRDARGPDEACERAAPGDVCAVAPQCGCGAAETCDVEDSAGSVHCVIAGKYKMGSPCTTTVGCERGLTCVYGICHAYCANPGAACGVSGTGPCVQLESSGGPIPNLSVCFVACDLRDPLSCGGTTAAGTGVCQVDPDGVTDCRTGGTKTAGQSCTSTPECGPALVCVLTGADGGAGTCRRWCRVGTNDCGGVVTCSGFQTKVQVGAVEYGACP